jgi:hypothetical protein
MTLPVRMERNQGIPASMPTAVVEMDTDTPSPGEGGKGLDLTPETTSTARQVYVKQWTMYCTEYWCKESENF